MRKIFPAYCAWAREAVVRKKLPVAGWRFFCSFFLHNFSNFTSHDRAHFIPELLCSLDIEHQLDFLAPHCGQDAAMSPLTDFLLTPFTLALAQRFG